MMVRQNAFSFSELDQTKESWEMTIMMIFFWLGLRIWMRIEEFIYLGILLHPCVHRRIICKKNMHKSEECKAQLVRDCRRKKIIIIGNWKRAISRMDTNEALSGRKEWNSFMKIAFQFFFFSFFCVLRLNTDSLCVHTKRCFNEIQKKSMYKREKN